MRVITATTGAAGTLVALALVGCGSAHGDASGTPTPKASVTAPSSPTASANPFASWSSTCITLANELQSAPYDFSYTASGKTTTWDYSSTLTYGQLGNLGTGTHDNKNDLAHLSYLANTVESSSQLASDLGDAGTATISPADGVVPQKVNGVSIYNNSAYHQLQDEQVPESNLSNWVNNYLMPVLNDCSEGD